ncbi:MAG TPA: ABC transporter permease subunit [Candidatus Eisenbergiella merdavium]|uniref:ABC transporter permease subunit n=1 Tax=Candidatus Eisenbergiella merdavium TaxID=2838551 RepID=A0A9D2NE68_9FIRM|nr:ABC transporter permease subunit [Candidatus Eisenbergiella merdavium]
MKVKRRWQLYVLLTPALLYFAIFRYGPMYGLQLAFRDFMPNLGISGSEWIGLENFRRFFNSYHFEVLLKNTLTLSLYQLLVGFPLPILLALSLHALENKKVAKCIQTIVYAPYFISTVVLVGMINIFFSMNGGLINSLLALLGKEQILFLGKASYFPSLYVWSGVWQSTGWSAIIYLAALSSVNPELHEAAKIDGAGRFQRILHIDIPHIVPTIITLLILNAGKIMSVGFEKAYLMQNSLNLEKSEIISTYVYKVGLLEGQYGFSTAVDIFNAVINCVLLVLVNWLSKKVSGSSLW